MGKSNGILILNDDRNVIEIHVDWFCMIKLAYAYNMKTICMIIPIIKKIQLSLSSLKTKFRIETPIMADEGTINTGETISSINRMAYRENFLDLCDLDELKSSINIKKTEIVK